MIGFKIEKKKTRKQQHHPFNSSSSAAMENFIFFGRGLMSPHIYVSMVIIWRDYSF